MQHYISDSIYGLTLAWITSENSTKQLECRHLDSIFFAGPYLLCYCVRSRPHLSVSVANCLSAPFSNQLSSRVPLPHPATPRFPVQKPFVWFRAKTDKGIVCLAGRLYSVTSESTHNYLQKNTERTLPDSSERRRENEDESVKKLKKTESQPESHHKHETRPTLKLTYSIPLPKFLRNQPIPLLSV